MQYDPTELATGTRIEGEHTQDVKLAQKIAMAHLNDDPRYYTKLKAAGLEEEEGALTPFEAGMGEPSDMGGVGTVMPVAPSVAVIKISGPTDAGQTSLSSSGMGRGGAPRILKTSSIEAPAEKNKVGPNKVVVSKTPAIGGAPCDPLDHFGSQMVEKW